VWVERRLAAILAADVVGYSRLMQADEAGTLAALKARRTELLQPLVAEHHGRIVKHMGDGVLVEFGSAFNAVTCAIELQAAMEAANEAVPEDRRIVLRIGISLGDVVVEDNDLYGDGVNIAARLENLAEPGSLCISANVFEHINGKLPCSFMSLGPQKLKNIKPVHVYRLARGDKPGPAGSGIDLPLPDRPSIAVLPFLNMGADPEQEYFVDGLTEDLITDLARVPDLFVIARNSSFIYKGKSTDARQVARELGVGYLLEGSVRRAANAVRINAQLIDAVAGGHVWAERFDLHLADIFAVQDEVIGKIVEAMVGRLVAARLPERYRPASLAAHDLCLRGRAAWAHSAEAGVAACSLFEEAIRLDPDYAEAHRWLALGQSIGWLHMDGPEHKLRASSMASARKAVALDPGDSGAHWILGFILLYERLWEDAALQFATALRLNPNDADAWSNLADLRVMEGRGAEAITCVERAFRLNPHPPGTYFWDLGQAQYAAGQYEAAARTLCNQATYRTGSRRFLAAALAQLGRLEEAREEGRLFLEQHPHFRISYWVKTQPFRDLATRDRFVDGYRMAGLPE
jgi:TolB-like protein/class 3 adenylate cyclase/cytochrome c-type biogenesis protein CcmH/NrfG